MRAQVRSGLAYGMALLAGALLFFLSFAAIFNGSWPLLLCFLLGYAAVGALAVWAGDVTPTPLALVLTAPAIPWVAWLFPASIPESGVVRALAWPVLVLIVGGLGWVGGHAGRAARARQRPRL
jgi:hypothetical protein